MVCVGLPAAGTAIAGADPMYMCMKRLTIKGSLVGSMSETDEALAFAARGLVKPIYQVFPFKDFHEAVQKLKNFQVAGRAIIGGFGLNKLLWESKLIRYPIPKTSTPKRPSPFLVNERVEEFAKETEQDVDSFRITDLYCCNWIKKGFSS